jgi:hypothetical protein
MPLSYTGITAGVAMASAQLKQVLDLLTGAMTDQAVYVANSIRASTTGAISAVYFAGGTASGAPTTGAHLAGEFVADLTGKWWMCTVSATPGTWIQMGASLDSTAGDYASLVAAGSAAVPGAIGKGADAGHAHPALVNPAGGFTGNLLQLQLASVDKFKVDQTGLLTTAAGAVFSGPLSGITTLAIAGALSGVTTLAIAGALSGVTTIAMTGALTGATGVTATNLTGTLQTAAQPNLTSHGTLTALDTSAPATFPSYVISSGLWNGTHYQATIGWGNQARQIFTASTRDDTKAIEGDILVNA